MGKYVPKNSTASLSLTFSQRTMAYPIKPLDLKLDLFALSSIRLIQNNCEAIIRNLKQFMVLILFPVIGRQMNLYVSLQRVFLYLFMNKYLYMRYILWLKRIEYFCFCSFAKSLLDLLCYSRRNIFNLEMLMETPPDLILVSNDTVVDDLCMMTKPALSHTKNSEFSISESVVTRYAEKIYPGYCDINLIKERTFIFMYSVRKKWTMKHKNVVTIYCTKCIQMWICVWIWCLIIIRHIYVLQVTAIISILYFHRLFFFLFYKGDLRYGLYVRIGFFTICIKFYYWTCPNMFLLLNKNRSILE